MNTQANWLMNTILSVDSRILRIVEFDLKISRLVNTDDWTVQKAYYMNLSCKTTSSCKIPIVQVDWWFKLIQYSFNNQYCLIESHFICHSASLSSQLSITMKKKKLFREKKFKASIGINYNEENKLFKAQIS